MDNAIFIMKANLFDPPGEKVVKGPERVRTLASLRQQAIIEILCNQLVHSIIMLIICIGITIYIAYL